MLAVDEYTLISPINNPNDPDIVMDIEFPRSDPFIQWEIRHQKKTERLFEGKYVQIRSIQLVPLGHFQH